MNRHELNVQFDIAESGIAPLSIKELLAYENNPEAIQSIHNPTGVVLSNKVLNALINAFPIC